MKINRFEELTWNIIINRNNKYSSFKYGRPIRKHQTVGTERGKQAWGECRAEGWTKIVELKLTQKRLKIRWKHEKRWRRKR